MELLYAGLQILKPPYYTVDELKKQREFTIDAVSIQEQERLVRERAELDYTEYAERFAWYEKFLEGRLTDKKKEMHQYIEQRIDEFRHATIGEYSLN